MTNKKETLALCEIGFVVLIGFITNFLMIKYDFHFFALPHLMFLLAAIIFRSFISNWKFKDYGFTEKGITYQIKLGIIIWVVNQTYHSVLHIFSPLFPQTQQLGAIVFKITTIETLIEKIALFKAGIIETLRYFSYIQGFLMEIFGSAIGAFMTFIYFGTSHMGIMSLIVLPVSFLFVYFYRTYKLIIPVIIFHMLGDTVGFIQIYLSYKDHYIYNLAIFITLVSSIWIFRNEIKDIFAKIGKTIRDDYLYLKNIKVRVATLSFILPIWLHFLLFISRKYP